MIHRRYEKSQQFIRNSESTNGQVCDECNDSKYQIERIEAEKVVLIWKMILHSY